MDIKKLPFKQYDVWKRKSGAMGYIMEIDLVKNNFVTYTITANYNNLKYKETKLKPMEKFIDMFNEKVQKENDWILIKRK